MSVYESPYGWPEKESVVEKSSRLSSRLLTTRSLNGLYSMIMAVVPIVQDDERDQRQSYAAEENPLWYQQSIDHEGYTDMTAEELLNRTVPFAYPVGLFGTQYMLTNLDPLLSSKQTEELYGFTNATRDPPLVSLNYLLLMER
eukprot:scaffold5747_cov126-Cylindrotheca_fusiformis.AAC.3